eukprot:TRINITY_DN32766_c0_g1_i1.p1 TRINITY_DN32766_c0_g1~~TRINITY_DN32766_c0_g1_i1.p1  ORF type:complete len:457 (+),score=73.07 TRINITY_DN32766_c0_g1_i1:222-1592(+)
MQRNDEPDPESAEFEASLLPPLHVNVSSGELPEGCKIVSMEVLLGESWRCCRDSACVMNENLMASARRVWTDVNRPGANCQLGMAVATVIFLQYQLALDGSDDSASAIFRNVMLQAQQALQPFADSGVHLDPFPFNGAFLDYYQRFVPITDAQCLKSDWLKVAPEADPVEYLPGSRTILLPIASLEDAGCFQYSSDFVLLSRCNAWQTRSYLVNAHQKGRFQGLEAPRAPISWRCPQNISRRQFGKYDQAPRDCSRGFGAWGGRITNALKCVAVRMGEVLQLRPGQMVLDYGSGCGWFLSWLGRFFGIRGYGIEAVGSSVAWSRRFSIGDYCEWSELDLRWVPNNAFDAVTAYWVLSHYSRAQQCSLAKALLRKLRPGGRLWIGGNSPASQLDLSGSDMDSDQWLNCLRTAGKFSVEFIDDSLMFRHLPAGMADIGNLQGDYVFYPPTFSVIVKRL